jgi:hypothetical protein
MPYYQGVLLYMCDEFLSSPLYGANLNVTEPAGNI